MLPQISIIILLPLLEILTGGFARKYKKLHEITKTKQIISLLLLISLTNCVTSKSLSLPKNFSLNQKRIILITGEKPVFWL